MFGNGSIRLALRAFVLAALAVFWVAPARAEVRLCLEVKSDRDDRAAFEKLVRSEIARHTSHRLSDGACESRLLAELFYVGGVRYLTLRIDSEIPVRYTLKDDGELEPRLADGLGRVLGSDPSYVAQDPARLTTPERAARSVLIRGNNSYRLALLETVVRTDTGAAFAPGLAFELTRGADHFAVFARAALSGLPGEVRGDDRALRLLGQVEAGLNYETSARAATSAYFGAGAGVGFLRFEGRVDPADEASLEDVNAIGATLQARAGLRLFRTYDFDCDVFAIGALPLFASKNPDGLLFGEDGVYTPFVQLGLGVGF